MVRQAHHERVLRDFERRSEDFEKALVSRWVIVAN